MNKWEFELKLHQLNLANHIEKSVDGSDLESFSKQEELKNKACDNVEKSLNLGILSEEIADSLIEKARTAKYFKREGTPGHYKYYYTEAQYNEAKDDKKKDEGKKVLVSTNKPIGATIETIGVGGKVTSTKDVSDEGYKKDDVYSGVEKDKEEILKITKELNNLKVKRSGLLKDSPSYKELDAKIKKIESKKITDKDGNTIGWGK